MEKIYSTEDIADDDKKNSADLATSGENKTISNNTGTNYIKAVNFSQQLENLPEELFSSKRFFPVGVDKIPHLKNWSNPANQSFCTEIQEIAGFDTCGHGVGDDYLFLDFDHVLDDNGEFTNPLAEKWYNMIHSEAFGFYTGCYCERSISGRGLHIFAKPTKNKFPAINGGDKGSIYFTNDKKNGAKIEVFYQSSGRYCLVTGKVFNCEPKASIPIEDEADDLFQSIIDALPRTEEHSEQGEQGNEGNEGNNLAEILKILELMPAEKLVRNDWATVGMILKYEGLSFEIFDSWSAKDKSVDAHGKTRYNQKDCKYQWDSFKTAEEISNGATMGTLVFMAKKFGYKPPHRCVDEIVRTRDKISDCPVNLSLPNNFIFNKHGITLVIPPKKETDDPKYIPIARTPVVVTRLLSGHTDGMTRYEIAIRSRDKWKLAEVDGQILLNPRKVYDLADKGVLITDGRLTQFFASLIALNEKTIKEITIYSKPGWHGDAFIYPNASEYAEYRVARAGIEYSEMFSVMGEFEEWVKKFKEASKSCVHRMILGAGLAAPLLKILGLPNFWLHINGRKNLAKTPLLKLALSVYGNPQYLMRSFDSSPKNRVTMAVGLNDFPQGFDELETLGKKGEEELQKSIYDFVEGMDGQKNKRNGDVRAAEHFRGVRLSTGEQPLHKASHKGGAFKRAIDIHISKPLVEDADARSLHLFCSRNYGHFGRQWIEYIRANKAVLVKDFAVLCDEIFATFGNELEPAHVTAICACILAYWHFRKCIGLETSFDLYHAQSDVRIISRHLPTQDEISDVKRWVDLFAGYVGSHPKHFWRKVVLADGTIPTETFYAPTLCGRIFDDSKVAINTTSFKEICAELNIIAEKFINELYEGNYLVGATSKNKAKKIRIGNNTVRAYVFKEGLLWEYAQNNDADSEDDSIQA